MAHLPNPIFYAVGHLKSFYYKWEGRSNEPDGGTTECRRTGEKKEEALFVSTQSSGALNLY